MFFQAIAFYLLINGISWQKYNRQIHKVLSKLELSHEWNQNNELEIFINRNRVTKALDLTIIEETTFYYTAFEDVVIFLKKYLEKYFISNSKNQIFVGSKASYLISKSNMEFFVITNFNIRMQLLEKAYQKRGDCYLKDDLRNNLINNDSILLECENFPVIKTSRHKTIFFNNHQKISEIIKNMKNIIENTLHYNEINEDK